MFLVLFWDHAHLLRVLTFLIKYFKGSFISNDKCRDKFVYSKHIFSYK